VELLRRLKKGPFDLAKFGFALRLQFIEEAVEKIELESDLNLESMQGQYHSAISHIFPLTP